MGLFDTYGGTQLKAGDPWGRQYEIGDDVLIPDGVYVDFDDIYQKAVVIEGGKFVAELDVFNHWGEKDSGIE